MAPDGVAQSCDLPRQRGMCRIAGKLLQSFGLLSQDAKPKPGHVGIFERLPEPLQRAPQQGIRRQRRCPLPHHRHGIAQARPDAHGIHRPAHLRTGMLHHQQVAGQIAAVHGRNIARLQRAQVLGVVPIEEMAAIPLHLVQGRHGGFQPFHGLPRADPAEIARRQDHIQIHADIGGRGAMRHRALGHFLEIVRRQMVVGRGHEFFEEGPGLTRCQTQRVRVLPGNIQMRFDTGRPAGPARDQRRRQPQQRKGRGDQQIDHAAHTGGRGHRDSESHASQQLDRKSTLPAAAVIGRLRKCYPFQQIRAGDEQPKHGAQDGVQRQIGDPREKSDIEQYLGGGEQQIVRHVAGMAAQGEAFAPGYDRRQDRQQRRQRNHQRQEGGPHPGSGRGQLPADQECQQGGGRRKGTPDIVQHLPAAQRRHARTLLRIAKTDPQNPGQQLPVAAHPAVLARHLDIVARGKFLHQLDVGGQRGAREHAFQ